MLPPSLRPLQSFRSSKSFKDILGSPKKSSTETGFLNGFERFECIAEEWTLLRLKDAHALSNLSEKLNNGMLYPLHKNLGLFMRSLPIYIPWLLTAVSFPIKGMIWTNICILDILSILWSDHFVCVFSAGFRTMHVYVPLYSKKRNSYNFTASMICSI